ncbi:MAG: sigma-70 family RNA polymerase sigma factor [Solirubrobacterales bacterium]|nr:sigma-70 family RNA polymerase sigma factor [Solirubrobacterales bacterium]
MVSPAGARRRRHEDLEDHRTALTRHCARMLGSRAEAEDAVQETMLRAWRGRRLFEGRSLIGSWLRRIATNVCIDMLDARSRHAVPLDPASLQEAWLEAGPDTDPAAQTLTNESFQLALLLALERLPAGQRAVLMLREALGWKASEVAELLGISRAAVNSALQRARASLASDAPGEAKTMPPLIGQSRQDLLASYLVAFT